MHQRFEIIAVIRSMACKTAKEGDQITRMFSAISIYSISIPVVLVVFPASNALPNCFFLQFLLAWLEVIFFVGHWMHLLS